MELRLVLIDAPFGAVSAPRFKELGWWQRGPAYGRVVWDREDNLYRWTMYRRGSDGELIEVMRHHATIAAAAMFAVHDAMALYREAVEPQLSQLASAPAPKPSGRLVYTVQKGANTVPGFVYPRNSPRK